MKAKYIVCNNVASKTVWMKGFLKNLNMKEIVDMFIEIMCANQATICIIENDEFVTRDIDCQWHYILIWY